MANDAQGTSSGPSNVPQAVAGSPPGGTPPTEVPAATVPAAEAPVVGPAILEADTGFDDENEGDNDSALDVASTGSRTTSLASSILKYRVENGRTYHAYKAGSYILPNDEFENDRLDLQHHLALLTLNGQLHLCPAGKEKQLNRVLDAGCGTGIWAIDFADEHPEAEVVGVDLSPIQPSFVPSNVSFYVDDLEEEWVYNRPFDFVYMRMLSASISDWPKLFRQTYNNLVPGGYVELLDPIYPMDCDDGTFPEDCALHRWSELMNEAATKLGSSLDSGLNNKRLLAAAGFTNIVETVFKWPASAWPKDPKYKELGAWSHENVISGLQALSLVLFTRALGWTAEQLETFLVAVRKDLKNRNIHAYWRIVVVYGQKPT